MSETEMNIQFDMPKNRSNVIKVIGVGGGGSNAINYMFQQGINGVDFVVCNTDSQALENSPVPAKVQLGVNLTEGLGAGANPEIGEQAALESFEEIKNLLDTNTKMLFITAGMGGGTGTGAAPIIAKQARDMDILTVGIVTIPFKFEGKVRNEQARRGLEKLRKNVDSLIVIDNNKLREVYGNLGFKSGFAKADEVLATASRGIAEVITHHYTQNIDLRDAKTVLSNSGTAIMGSATASGGNRAQEAITKAMDSPLLNDNKITGAKNVLLLIVSGTQEITLDEIGEINDYIQEEAGNGANIIMGVGEDQDLGEAVSVTIIATGFTADQQSQITNTETKKIIHTLEDEQKSVEHNLNPISTGVINRRPVIEVEEEETPEEEPVQQPKMEAPTKKEPEMRDGKIIHSLEDAFEEIEEEEKKIEEVKPAETEGPLRLVPTSEVIRNMEVNYQEVVYDEDDFIFIETKETTPTEEETPEEPQSQVFDRPIFNFDLPIPKKKYEEPEAGIEDVPSQTIKFDLEKDNFDDAKGVAEEDPISLFPGEEDEGVTRYSLADYLEKERELTEAKPVEEEEPQMVRKQSSTRSSWAEEEVKTAQEEEEIDPMNMPISEELIARAAERRARMKNFNYKFRKSANVDEFEKQPAYKRAGLDLSDGSVTDKDIISRTSISDEDGEPQIRSNNSFLHDNVD